MAKSKKRENKTKQSKTESKKLLTLSSIQQDIFFLAALVVLLFILFKPLVIDGLSSQGADVVGTLGATHQVREYSKETGEAALWNPYLFSGMPQYHRQSAVTFSIDTILSYLSRIFSTVFIYYLFGAFGLYALFRYLNMSPLISFLSTIIFILMPHYKSLYTEGHMSKLRAIMFLPWVLLVFLYFLDKKSILSAAIFAIIFGAQIRTQHYQIVFYTALLIFAVGVYPMLKDLLEKKYLIFGKSTMLLLAAIAFGIMMSSQPLFLAKEYIPYSKRGKTTINLQDKNLQSEEKSTSDGVQIEYATQWSTHPSELLTWFIPRFYGGMSGEKYTGNEVPQLRNRVIPGYWGHMPFTQSYEYMGVISLLLAFIGIYAFRKNTFIISLLILAAFFILLSFGRHFISFYSLFYDHFPFFNKFRAPVMSVTVTSFIVAILAAHGLKYLFSLPVTHTIKENKPIIYIFAGFIVLGIAVALAAQGFGFTHARDNYDPQVIEIIKSARKEFLTKDLIRYFILVILAGGAVLAYLYRKISYGFLLVSLSILILFDLNDIQSRYHGKYIDVQKLEKQYFKKTDTDWFLLADKETYRIFPMGKKFSDNRWAYYHQTIGGYSAIKMYAVEELIANNLYNGWDKQLPLNFNVLKILNTKYIITGQKFNHDQITLVSEDMQNQSYTYLFNERLTRGFFVGNYKIIEDEYDRLAYINNKNFDPSTTAILEESPLETFDKPDSSWVIVNSLNPNERRFNVFSDRKTLFVISEIYYPPGWNIYLDGQLVKKIYKTDHAIQSIILPQGEHQVDVRFAPDSYYQYIKLSYASAGLLYFIIFLSLMMTYKDKWMGLLKKSRKV
jgi:hypothetical protein